MAKVLTVSKKFPAYHPRAGQDTFFVEKIYNSLGDLIPVRKCGFFYKQLSELNLHIRPSELLYHYDSVAYGITDYKHHTIREGKRWKTGDMASLRVWGNDLNPKSNRRGPYHSKQIVIAPDVEVIVFDFEIKQVQRDNKHYQTVVLIDGKEYCLPFLKTLRMDTLSSNDGLNKHDLLFWFKFPKPFIGQIISWNKDIKY